MTKQYVINVLNQNSKETILNNYTKPQLVEMYKALYDGLHPRNNISKEGLYTLCMNYMRDLVRTQDLGRML